jgi:hypothetical protein
MKSVVRTAPGGDSGISTKTIKAIPIKPNKRTFLNKYGFGKRYRFRCLSIWAFSETAFGISGLKVQL